MKTIFKIEEDISLELSQHIYDFMTRLKQYEIMILGKKFKVELPPLEESPLQPLLKPFIDDRFPLDSIREFAWVIGVDANHKALCIDLLSIGDVNQTLVYPWMAFRSTNFFAVSGIYLVHNHPSGNPKPSEADISLTKAIIDGPFNCVAPC